MTRANNAANVPMIKIGIIIIAKNGDIIMSKPVEKIATSTFQNVIKTNLKILNIIEL